MQKARGMFSECELKGEEALHALEKRNAKFQQVSYSCMYKIYEESVQLKRERETKRRVELRFITQKRQMLVVFFA